jgi:hypothetical protein
MDAFACNLIDSTLFRNLSMFKTLKTFLKKYTASSCESSTNLKKVLIFSEEETNGCEAPPVSEAIATMLGKHWEARYVSYGNIANTLANADYLLIAFPGADGDSCDYSKSFTRSDHESVLNFVRNGGLYLGICMGAAIAQLKTKHNGFGIKKYLTFHQD